jgi:O-antigen ligase
MATQTLTAMIAVAAAFAVISWKVFGRRGLAFVAAGLVVFGMLCLAYQPIRARIFDSAKAIRTGSFNDLVSGRLSAFTTASVIGLHHPVTGAGPGTFPMRYFHEKSAVEQRLRMRPNPSSFGEVHNDYLEALSEFGGFGVMIILAALWRLARTRAVENGDDEERARFVSLFAPALAATLALLFMGQFPLQLASTSATLFFFAGVVRAWGGD